MTIVLHGRVLIGPIVFVLGQFYFGQVQLRPILVCPFDCPKCQDEKKKEKMKKGRDNQKSPCVCEGVADRRPATPSNKHGSCFNGFMWSVAG